MNLHIDIVFALDKDVTRDKLQAMANKFPLDDKISVVIDDKNFLSKKEILSNDPDKWEQLWAKCRVVL